MPTVNVPADYASVTLALAAADKLGGWIIEVDPGTYNEALSFAATDGGWLLPATVRAADPNDKPVFTSTGAAQAVNMASIMKSDSAGIPILENLVFQGWTAATNGVIRMVADTTQRGCTANIRGCDFVGNVAMKCIKLCGTLANPGVVEKCTFKTSGQSIQVLSNYSWIENCWANLPTNIPFQSGAFLTSTYVYHCAVQGVWNTGGGIKVMTGLLEYKACSFKNTGTSGSHAIDASGGGSYTKCISHGTFGTVFAGTDGGGNLTSTDPEYTDADNFDFTTSATAPGFRYVARDSSVTTTIDDVSRADPTDVGPYEAIEPTVLGTITVQSDTVVRVDFSGGPNPDPEEVELVNVANWVITKESPDIGVALEVTEVTPAEDGSYVDLTLDREQTTGQVYTVTVSGVPGLT